MPNWKDPSEYNFLDLADEETGRQRFCWEFMRRNQQYKQDYETAIHTKGLIFDPPKNNNESQTQWERRVILAGAEPQTYRQVVYYAAKWGMKSPIQDPAIDAPPIFLFPYPKSVTRLDQVDAYFHTNESEYAPVTLKSEYLMVVLSKNRSLDKQLKGLKAIMNKEITLMDKPKNKKFTHWKTYLRLHDAKSQNISSKEITKYIKEYGAVEGNTDNKYPHLVSDHNKSANDLLQNPLSILK